MNIFPWSETFEDENFKKKVWFEVVNILNECQNSNCILHSYDLKNQSADRGVLRSVFWARVYDKLYLDMCNCQTFEPRSHFKSRSSLIVRVNVVLNRTVVIDSDWRFDYLCAGHLQSQSELYHVSWWCYALVIDLIGQLRRDVIGRLSVKPWCYWPWSLVIRNWCFSSRLLSQLNSRLLLVKLSVLQSFCRS